MAGLVYTPDKPYRIYSAEQMPFKGSVTDTLAAAQAEELDVLSGYAGAGAHGPRLTMMKSINPDLRTFIYVNGIQNYSANVTPVEMYAKTVNGKRLFDVSWQVYAFLAGHPAWIERTKKTAVSALGGFPWDGIFVDNMGRAIAQGTADYKEWEEGIDVRNGGTQGPVDSWVAGKAYRDGSGGQRDVVCLNQQWFKCKLAHTSSAANEPPNDTYWTDPLVDVKPLDTRTGAVFQVADWLTDTRNLLANLVTAISPSTTQPIKPVIANSVAGGPEFWGASSARGFLDVAHATAELFVRSANEPATAWPNESNVQDEISMLLDATAKGRMLLCITKMWISLDAAGNTTLPEATVNQWRKLTMGIFLMGADGYHALQFTPDKQRQRRHAFEVAAQQIGAAVDSYTVLGEASAAARRADLVSQARLTVNGKNYYRRRFDNGYVVLNPTSTAITAGDGLSVLYACTDVDGTAFGAGANLTVPANSARILIKQ